MEKSYKKAGVIDNMIKVRFAPSPTGLLHVGNIRIAILNYLFAKKNNGKFVLRIDDTDLERSTKESENSIIEDLKWLSIQWDEFYRQSANLEQYKAALDYLKKNGYAYPCYETKEELALKRKIQASSGAPPVYDRSSLNLSLEEREKLEASGIKPYWRFRLDDTQVVEWKDLVHGNISIPLNSISDPILMKPDGSFVYTFASVVDDINIGITHIIRGDDHITNTAAQIDIFKAISGKFPQFAHVPLLSSFDKQEVSKRTGSSLSIINMRNDNIDPHAIWCVLATLGTSNNVNHSDGFDKLVSDFSFEKMSLASPKFNSEEVRLLTKKIISEKSFDEVKNNLEKLNIKNLSEEFWNTIRGNLQSINEATFWNDILFNKINTIKEDEDFVRLMLETIADPLDFDVWITKLKQVSGKKGRDLFHPIRIVLTGVDDGPELKKIVGLLGYDRVRLRLENNLKVNTMSKLQLYNSFSNSLEDFVPIDPANVRVYACGPTVYASPHVGNARPLIVFDVLFRLFKQLYPNVTYVRNITDVDDKINTRARERNISIKELTDEVIEEFHKNISLLGILPVSHEPRATFHINEMLNIIRRLLDNGFAYESHGHVLFRVRKMPTYGMLSKRNIDDMIAGSRVEVAPYKEDPMDFVLWKPSDEGTPAWDSPFGRGRPGWHIECSAMSHKYLGDQFDIHAGGQDLMFPHHENEIAQNFGAFGCIMAKYWVHNGMLLVNGQKMSKSLGNIISLDDILRQHDGEVVRYAMLSSHYQKTLDWTDKLVAQSKQSLNRLYSALRLCNDETSSDSNDQIIDALCSNLNTPLALRILHELTDKIFKSTDQQEINKLCAQLKGGAKILGFLSKKTDDWFKQCGNLISNEEIERLIVERKKAKSEKNFQRADEIRQELLEKNIQIEDTVNGAVWRSL